MRVARHDSFVGCACLFDQCFGPLRKRSDHKLDLLAYIQAEIGRDLFVAAAARMKLESERSDALDQRQFDKMMNVLGGGMRAHLLFAGVGGMGGSDRGQRFPQEVRLFGRQDTGLVKGRRVRLAGGYVLLEEPPVKDDGALPRLELGVERLAKSTRPHLHGLLFARQRYSFSLAPASWGISLPLLRLRRPVAA